MISQVYVEETCKLGQGEKTCAFLMMGAEGFDCAKGTSIEATIRKRLEAGTMNAKGDNCEGWTKVGMNS
jgi:hypothetical protein